MFMDLISIHWREERTRIFFPSWNSIRLIIKNRITIAFTCSTTVKEIQKIWSNLCAACLFHFQRPCNEYFASHSFFNTITISSAPSWWSLVLHCCCFIHRVLDILLWNYNERNSIWRIQLLSIWIIWNAILCCKLYSKNVWRWVGVEQSADVIDNISLQSN